MADRPSAAHPGPHNAYAPQAASTLGLVFFPAFDWAISPSHPEREERLLYTQDQLREEGLFDIDGISEHRPEPATYADLALAHFCPPGFERIAETPHLISAGSAITAGRLVMEGVTRKAFALTRPPGHHAMQVVQGGRGFCAVNIEAVMLERLRRDYGVRRIAVVDTDCHHGDGTQDIYRHDPDTLFISVHQDGRTLYPGTGFLHELGGPKARGATVNIPLPPRTGDEGFLYAAEQIIRPILDAWKPDLVVNSAGQDNHFTDPITDMRLSAQGYARMVAAVDPDIAVLEGGYSIQGALPYVNLAVIAALAGLDYSYIVEPLRRESSSATDAATMDSIRALGDKVLELHANPGEADGYAKDGDFWVQERDIYYDTDGIRERQREELRDCPHCSGLLSMHTDAGRGPSLCLQLPRNACGQCSEEAERRFEKARTQRLPMELADQRSGEYRRG